MDRHPESFAVIIAVPDCADVILGSPTVIVEFRDGVRLLYTEERSSYQEATAFLEEAFPSLEWRRHDPTNEEYREDPEVLAVSYPIPKASGL